MEQLILHLIGDYITQSDWMANNKTKANAPALLPFFLLGGWLAVLVIFATHFFIDRFRLARFVAFSEMSFGWPSYMGDWKPTPKWIAILAHECFHATEQILNARGQFFDNSTQSNNEAFAYLHESIVFRCLQRLMPSTK